jgi:hypothetical protein
MRGIQINNFYNNHITLAGKKNVNDHTAQVYHNKPKPLIVNHIDHNSPEPCICHFIQCY